MIKDRDFVEAKLIKDRDFVEAIIDRMKHVVGVEKDSELAGILGAHRTGPAVWRSRPSFPANEIIKLAFEQNVSLDWLVFGRGSPSYGGGADLGEREKEGRAKHMETVMLPIFDLTSMVNLEKPTTYWHASVGWLHVEGLSDVEGETIVVRCASDTMRPTICQGQMIAIDRRPIDIDGVFLVRIGASYRIKRVQRMVDGSMRLICDNKAYADEVIDAAAAHDFEIIGYCAAVFSRIA